MEVFSVGDSCPCGSGNKLIDCCGQGSFGTFIIGFPKLDESLILKDLLGNSPEFKQFYSNERYKIKKYIVWRGVKNKANLANGKEGTNKIKEKSDLPVIILRKFPPKSRDAFIVAHEMMHLIHHFEHFPGVASYKEYERVPSALGSMIEDVIIDEKLSKYGFDVTASYIQEFNNSKKALLSVRSPPTHPEDIALFTFNYAGYLLAFNRLFDPGSSKPKFFSFFEARFSAIAKDAKDLTKIIEENGYNTPDQVRKLYNIIIDRYNLTGKTWVLSVK